MYLAMEHKRPTLPTVSSSKLRCRYIIIWKAKARALHDVSVLPTNRNNIRERHPPNPTWNSQHYETSGDRTARGVGQSQTILADPNVKGIYSIKPSNLILREAIKFENESSETQSETRSESRSESESESESGFEPESEPEMPTPKTDLAKSSELLAANLWNEAYGDLKSQEPDQLKMYEKAVTLWLEANSIEYVLHQPLVDIPLEDGFAVEPQPWRKWLCLQVRENYACPWAVHILKLTPPCDI